MQQNVNKLHFTLDKKTQVFTGDCLHGGKPFRCIYTLPPPHPDQPGTFLANDSVCSRGTVSRSAAVTKYAVTLPGLLPLPAEEL